MYVCRITCAQIKLHVKLVKKDEVVEDDELFLIELEVPSTEEGVFGYSRTLHSHVCDINNNNNNIHSSDPEGICSVLQKKYDIESTMNRYM